MKFKFSTKSQDSKSTLVFLCFQNKILSKAAQNFNDLHQNILERALKSNYFTGRRNETLILNSPQGIENARIILLGLGDIKTLSTEHIQNTGGSIFPLLQGTPDHELEIIVEDLSINEITSSIISANLAYGFLLRSWSFNKYKTNFPLERKNVLQNVWVITNDPENTQKLFFSLEQIAAGVFLSRELIIEPPNVIYPASFAESLQELTELGIKVEVLDLEELRKLKMGALLGVAQGSIHEPKVVVLQWLGGSQEEKPIAFVGKGVTFDAGGLNLKTCGDMYNLKYDMGGAAVVAGLMRALSGRKAKVNAIGIVGLVENMPSGSAQRPSDIVKSMSGKTIEVINTDAEGRLVLADVLWYTQEKFKPKIMIDIATLTGAIIISLGDYFAGLFSNNFELAEKLKTAGEITGERLWEMPLDERFEEQITSDIADLRNHVTILGPGGSLAAQFIKHFVNDVPWAHIDICGVIRSDRDLPIASKGPTAFGVRLLNELVQNYYEKK